MHGARVSVAKELGAPLLSVVDDGPGAAAAAGEGQRGSWEDRASCLSRWLWLWIYPLLARAYAVHRVRAEDLPPAAAIDDAGCVLCGPHGVLFGCT